MLNAERREHWRRHREMTEAWRTLAHHTARGRIKGVVGVRAIEYATEIIAIPVVRPPLADTGNHYPAVKAVIDGLVDAGVLFDDGPEWINRISLMRPLPVSSVDRERLTVVVHGVIRKEGRWR